MAKEWVLNIATNRWGLNKKSSVGPVAAWIRECSPRSIEDWEQDYLKRLASMLTDKGISLTPQQYLEGLGQKLYVKITEVIQAEIDEVNESDCASYIKQLVIDRTFEGFQTEIRTIHGSLREELGVEIKPAPDDWDRLYNVDFYIRVGSHTIGLQVKPLTYEQTPEIHKWKQWLVSTHEKFQRDHGGRVFTIFSTKEGSSKKIVNQEVVDDIRNEIARLQAA